MTTLISGQLGKAAQIRGDTVNLFDLHDKGPAIEARFSSLGPIFAAAEDLKISPYTSARQIRDALRTEWEKDRGLLLTLMTLDVELDGELKDETVPFANELLEHEAVTRFVLFMLHAKPIDELVLREGRARAADGSPLHSVLARTIENRAALEAVGHYWDALSSELFNSEEARKQTRTACVKAGVFYHLANALRANSPSDLNVARFNATMALQGYRNSLKIISQWFGPLKPSIPTKSHRPTIKVEADEEYGKGQYVKESKLSTHQRFQQVQEQLVGIRKSMQKLRMDAVREYTNQIVAQQLGQGEDQFAAKTLCNVAQLANECFQFSFAFELVKKATEVYSVDPIAWAMLADANIRLNRYDEALSAFDECRRLGRNHYASNGKGRVLRHQGRLVEARAEFEQVLQQFEHSPEVFNTQLVLGEVYRDLGEFESAAALYDRAIKQFPEQYLLLCAKGALLREIGQLDDSIKAFRLSFELHGITSDGCIGWAETLREKGDSRAALAIIESGFSKFPELSSIHRAKAEVLRSLGKQKEAITVYELIETEFAFDHSGIRGHIDTLIELGRFKEALIKARAAQHSYPNEAFLRLKEVSVLQKSGRPADALALLGDLSNDLPTYPSVKIHIAELLKQLGRLDDAKVQYEKLISEFPHVEALRVSFAAISVAMGDFGEALNGLRSAPPRTKTEWVGEHVRAMALLRHGHISSALRALETGSHNTPFVRQRGYFRTALLLAQIKARQLEEADPESIDSSEPIGNIIRLHVYALKKQVAKAQASLNALQDCPASIIPLRDELAAQMNFSKAQPQHDAKWVFEQEVAALALAPTYDIAA